jgi:hypothetical protein
VYSYPFFHSPLETSWKAWVSCRHIYSTWVADYLRDVCSPPICRSRVTEPLPNYRLAAHYRHRVFISWRVKFCTQGNTCIRYTDIHTERNITEIQYIYVSYMYIRHTDVRQKYLADCVLCCITILFFVIYWIPPTDYLRHKKCPLPWRKGRVTVNGAWI